MLARVDRERWLLAGVTLVLVGAGIGLRDPWPSDEPRFALIATQMLASGDWLIPQRGIEFYSDKPPLFFWLQALSIQAFGVRIGFLLPALASSVAVVLLTHDLALRLYGRERALMAGFALLALPQFVLIGRSGQVDPVLGLWTALGLYGILRYVLVDRRAGWLMAGFLAMGLGVITKGVGFLPLLLLPIFAWARYRGWRHLAPADHGRPWRHWAVAAAALLAPILLWVAAVELRVAADPTLAAYRDDLFFHQTAGRYLGSAYHPKPWWYLIVEVIPVFWLPLVLLLPYLAPRWWRCLRAGDARVALPLIWVLTVIVFFSFSGGKRGVYVAPAMPALVLAAAPWLPEAFADRRVRRLFYFAALGLSVVAMATGAWLLAAPPVELAPRIGEFAYSPFAIVLLIGLIALPLVIGLGIRRAGHGFLALFATAWLAYGLLAYPLLDESRSGRRLMRLAEAELESGQVLGLVGWKEQMMLQVQVPVQDFGFRQPLETQTRSAVRWLAEDPQRRRILLPVAAVADCVRPEPELELTFAHGRRWLLIGPDSIAARCLPRESG